MSGLEKAQVDFLLKPITPGRVQKAQGQSHLAAWDVRRTLLRAFGWGGWSYDLLDVTLIHERETPSPQPQGKPRWTIVYRVTLRLSIRDAEGAEVMSFTEAATGDATNQPSVGDAHDMALKTAESQALKRAAMNLGDQFGLGLYNNGKLDAVVVRSLPHLPKGDVPALPAQETVTAGDDDAHAQPTSAPESTPSPSSSATVSQERIDPPMLSAEAADQWADTITEAATTEALGKVWEDVRQGGQLDYRIPVPEGQAPVTLRDLMTFRGTEIKAGS